MKVAELKCLIETKALRDVVSSIAPPCPGRDFVMVFLHEEITDFEKNAIRQQLPLSLQIQYEVEQPD